MRRYPLLRSLSLLSINLLFPIATIPGVVCNTPPLQEHAFHRPRSSCTKQPGCTTTIVHGATGLTSAVFPITTSDSGGESDSEENPFTAYFKLDATTFILPDASDSWIIKYRLSSIVGDDGVALVYQTPYLHHADTSVIPKTVITSTLTQTEYQQITTTVPVSYELNHLAHTTVSREHTSFHDE